MNTNIKISRFKNLITLSQLCLLLFFLFGCTKDINNRGNLPIESALNQLKPGSQTRQDIESLLGTPSHTSIFENEIWYYISSTTTQYAFYPTEVLQRDVLEIKFDKRGVLEEVSFLNIDDGSKIVVVDRETPTMGREYSLIEQLIGNLGRFDRGRPEAGP